MLRVVFRNPWVQAIILIGVLALLGLLCYILSPVLISLFFAFLVAYILNPVVDILERRRVPRMATILSLAVVGIVILLAIPVFLIPNLVYQADRLVQGTAQTASTGVFPEWANRLAEKLPLDDLVRFLGWAPSEGPVNAREILATRIGTYVRENALQILRSYAPSVASASQMASTAAAQVVASIWHGIVKSAAFVANVVLFAFVAGYLLRDFHNLIAASKALVPPRHRDRVFHVVREMDLQVHGFLRGQLLVCMCLGLMYGTGFVISGVPFAVPIAAVGGLASFVPYLGFALTSLPALILTGLEHGIDWHVLGVCATFAIAQSIEGSFLTPRIVGEQVGLNPVWVILAMLVFASLFGFLGLLLAIPIAAALKVLVVEALEYYKRSPLFETEGEEGDPPGPAGA